MRALFVIVMNLIGGYISIVWCGYTASPSGSHVHHRHNEIDVKKVRETAPPFAYSGEWETNSGGFKVEALG